MQLIVSEARKMRANPTIWWLLLGVFLLTPGVVVGGFVIADLQDLGYNSEDGLRQGFHALGSVSMLAEVAGIIGMAGEFRFGQADQTFLSAPRRRRVVAVKMFIYTLLGAFFGLLAAGLALATGVIWLDIKGSELLLEESLVWSILGACVVSATLFAALGVAVGAAFRNQIVGIVTVLGLQAVIETSIFSANTELGRWLPGLAGNALRKFPAEDLLTPQTGILVLLAWIVGVLIIGVYRTLRSDIT